MGSALLKLREQFRRIEQEEIAHSDSLQDIIDKNTYANIISLEETRELADQILYTALANDQYESSLEQLSRTHIRKPGQTTGRPYKNNSQI